MQPQIADCRVTDILYRSPRTTVYRGIRHSDARAVVIKALTSDFPNPRDLARLRLEFRVATRVQGPGVINVLGLEPWGNNLALIEEQVDGAPLSPPPRDERHLETFFTVAVSITAALARVHEQVVHGDVAPSNILWDPIAQAVKLIDFGAASEIRSEHHAPTTDGLSDSSMPYMAPERSGRINRDLDHRTDLYSLGATFYELLTGVRPFEAHERAELIYCHVTRQPRPPHEVVPGIPVLLSRLVMRLMAKNPEDRYQTAKGLLADLEECQRRWSRSGRLDAFPLGQRDSDGRLRTVQRVCGREHEMQTLFTAFEEARRGASRLVMVSGAPGVGKTVLVKEIRRTIFRLGGFFIEGKFDQFQRHAPYAAMADAFRQLVTQMLSAPEERLTALRTELRDALAPNGRLVLDLVPEMERVIGPQPDMAAANPVEEQNRFHVTMTALFTILARAHRPLVVFLDDLHWSDEPTVALIETLMSERSLGSLLLIGAYRGHEVDETHPLTRLLSAPERQGLITRIDIRPLDRAAVDQLVADSLAMPSDRTTSLSAALFLRTGGNPLAVRELLSLAGREGVLWFDAAQGEWRWDVDRIAGTAEGDDVVDMLLGRLRQLSPATQRWLQMASCLGNAFDLDTLAVVGGTTRRAAARGLWETLREGLVQPMGEDYRLVSEDGLDALDTAGFDVRYQFRHDRVQQAAYALVPEHEVQALHLRIGRSLDAELPAVQRGERIIEIVRHLNIGASLLETGAERLALAQMNLEAARKARASAAYGPALELLETARALLPPGAWRDFFELAYDIHHLGAACAYMSGCLDVAEVRVAELLAQARTPREKANVYSMQLQQLTVCNRMDEAVAAGLTGLRLLGIPMSARPSELSIMGELVSAKLALGRRKVADLEDESVVTDPDVLLAMRILIDFIPPAYLTGNDRLFAVAVLKQVRLSLKHGVCAEAAAAYASYVVLLAGLGDLRNADAFAKLALRLTEKFNAVDSRCRNLVLCTLFGASWNDPWRDLRASFQEAVRAGLESGDLLFTTYACGWVHLWAPDVDIKTAFEEGQKYLAIIEKTDYQNARDAARLAQQFWANLLGRTVSEMSLSSEDFDEDECRERMQEVRNISGVGIDALYRIVLAVIYGREEAGFKVLNRSQRFIRALAGSPYMVDYCLHGFLACAASASNPRHGPQARRYMKSLLKQMRVWAAHAPDNFRQHALLMEAESARVTGDHSRAMWLFDEAVSASRTGLFPRYEALANERAARFFAEQGLCRVAATYLAEARYHYARWGATRKVAALNEDLQRLAESTGGGLSSSEGLVGTATEVDEARTMSRLADGQTMWRAAQALSEEVILERLLERLMSTLRQGAGATRVSLLLRDDDGDQLLVQADSRDERPPQVMQRQRPDGADLPLSVIRYVLRSGEPLILSDARREASLMSDPYLRGNDTCSMLALPLTHRGQHLGVLYLENALTTHAFDGDSVFTLQMLASQVAISLQNAQLYEQVRRLAESFSRFVPREFLRSLGHTQPVDIRFGESVQKEMTVLFADIRRFTTLVERMSADENISFLNTYIEYMEPAILAHGGFIDSYVGDAIMALFDGSPTRAVEAAVAMLRALEDFNTERASAGAVAVDIGIGLNTGRLTLGTIGGAERLKCGVVGDAVNVAARIESLTKRYRARLLISGVTHRQLTYPIRRSTRLVDRVRVAGHDQPVELFEVFAADPPLLREQKRSTLGQWEAAMDLYFAGRFAEAVLLLSGLRTSSALEDDAVLKVHLARAQRYAQSPPGPDWDGVETLSEK
jgi:predicted ATPase/class 3 adenylate cyclase/GAF domain-containing protein